MTLIQRLRRWAAIWLLLCGLCGTVAAAAPQDSGFEDYKPQPATQNVRAPLFVVYSYSAIWLLLTGFALAVWRRQRAIERELKTMRAQLARERPPSEDQ